MLPELLGGIHKKYNEEIVSCVYKFKADREGKGTSFHCPITLWLQDSSCPWFYDHLEFNPVLTHAGLCIKKQSPKPKRFSWL